jgi:glutaredoxin
MNTIVVFTLNGCTHCSKLKKRLDDLSIKFLEIEIGQNKEIWENVVQQTGKNVLPTVFIKKENSDDGPVYVPGRDYQSEDEIVEIIKSYI